MLDLRHKNRRYGRARFGVAGPAFDSTPLAGPALDRTAGLEDGPSLRSLEELTLDDFAAGYLELRDTLALRRLKGEVLSERENSALDLMNRWLDAHLPRPSPLDERTSAAVDEIFRRAHSR